MTHWAAGMQAEELKLVYRLDQFRVGLALQGIESVLGKHNVPCAGFEMGGKPINLPEALPQLKRGRRQTFHIVGQGFEFLLGCVRNSQLDFLRIRSEDGQQIAWDEWAMQFIANSDFV